MAIEVSENGCWIEKIVFRIHSTAELQQVFHPCTHQAAGAGAGLGELMLWDDDS